MLEKLRKLPIEFYMGTAWIILAVFILIFNPENKIEYAINIILGFMALFTATIISKLNKILDEIKSSKRGKINE